MAYDVEVGAPAQLYARALPAGAIAVGIVRKETGETGALLRFQSGAYAQMSGNKIRPLDRREVLRAMARYARAQTARGTPLRAITRHMLGLYHGQSNGRALRRMLSDSGMLRDSDPRLLDDALAVVEPSVAEEHAA